uniref:Uncharacterized protein n=1 Tax=Nothobranchius furzeri TaxID=105023 RepID=A0A8C6M3Y5_NOTFU
MAAEELELLRNRLREQEEQVRKAAQAGLGLLNQQVELQSQLDEQRVEMTKTIEALEQDKYSLQRELDLKTQMLEFLQSDYETFKKQQKQTLDEHQEHLERSHNMALSELHNKVELHNVTNKQQSHLQTPFLCGDSTFLFISCQMVFVCYCKICHFLLTSCVV